VLECREGRAAGDGRGSSSEMPGARVNEEPLIKIRSPVSLGIVEIGTNGPTGLPLPLPLPPSPPNGCTSSHIKCGYITSRAESNGRYVPFARVAERFYAHRECRTIVYVRSCKPAKAVTREGGSAGFLDLDHLVSREMTFARSRSSYDGNGTWDRAARDFVLVRRAQMHFPRPRIARHRAVNHEIGVLAIKIYLRYSGRGVTRSRSKSDSLRVNRNGTMRSLARDERELITRTILTRIIALENPRLRRRMSFLIESRSDTPLIRHLSFESSLARR